MLVLGTSTVISTAAALWLQAMGGAPGDFPLPLLGLGCLLAVSFCRLAPALHLGLAAMSGFPIGATIDMILHGDHNLLPFEFALYCVYMGIGVGVASAGKWFVQRP